MGVVYCFRGEREAWIKGKYSQHKFVSLEIFLTKCQKLDKGIIKNLARMKVYHEEKGIERTDSKKSKILRRKLALKGHKSKADKRKSAPPSVFLSDLTTKDYENLEKMASSLLEQSNDEVSNCSSDSHDDERPDVVSPDDASRPRASSVSGTRSMSFEDGRDRGDSVGSNLSDDGLVARCCCCSCSCSCSCCSCCTSNHQKWLKTPSFDTFDLEMCFAPQRSALFRHRIAIASSKSGPSMR